MKYDSRIKSIEKKSNINANTTIVLGWIKEKRFYDDLSNEERYLYWCYYLNMSDVRVNEMELMYQTIKANEDRPLHFILEKRPPPPTPEEMQERIREVEEFVFNAQKEFNNNESKF